MWLLVLVITEFSCCVGCSVICCCANPLSSMQVQPAPMVTIINHNSLKVCSCLSGCFLVTIFSPVPATSLGKLHVHVSQYQSYFKRHTVLQCRAPFRAEKIKPVAKLTSHQLAIRPSDHKLQPSNNPARDQLPLGRTIHTLLLTYKFKAEAEGKYKVTVPILNRYAG